MATNLIGINGYIGSGKDTVGKIIQYLTSGADEDDSIKEYLKKYDSLSKLGIGRFPEWEIKKYAGKLKQIASLLTGIPVENFEDQEFKKTYLSSEWSVVLPPKINGTVMRLVPYEQRMTVREFLQKLGTESVRDVIHTNAWVNALFADYKCPKDSDGDGNCSNYCDSSHLPSWIITDLRFPNEAEAIAKRGGITIRVNRSEKVKPDDSIMTKILKTTKDFGITRHISETALDDYKFNYVIENDGSLEDLVDKVKTILHHEKLLLKQAA